MRAALALLLAALPQGQAPLAPEPEPQSAPVAAAADVPAPEPWTRPLGEGLAELRAAANARDRAAVLELAARLGRSARDAALEPARGARVLHDLGLARAAVDDLAGALADLRAAAGLAGPGAVRESALYAAGTARLERAEMLRLAVPEIAQAQGLQAPEAPADEAAPDPLDVARQAYLDARGDLLERLRLDARDADTRANLELVTRRLRELDALEGEREQQQDEQQDEQDPDPEQDPEQQPPEDQEPQEQPSEEQEPQDEQSQDQQQDPQDQESQEQEQEQQEQEEQPPEDSQSESEEQEQESQPEQAGEGEPEERVLSKEEVQRLLDQLAEIEAEAEAVRARLRDRRRKPVEKDW